MRDGHHGVRAISTRQPRDKLSAVGSLQRFFRFIELDQCAHDFVGVEITRLRQFGEKIHLEARHIFASNHGRDGHVVLRLAAQSRYQPVDDFV